MTDFAYNRIFGVLFRKYRFVLCVCWMLGLCAGSCLGLFFEPYSISMMRSAAVQPVSIVGLCLSALFPLVFTYFSVYLHKPIIIFSVCLFKTLAFAFSGAVIAKCFGNSGWLMQVLLLFSDSCVLPVLFLVWFWCLGDSSDMKRIPFLSYCIFCITVAAVDCYLVSPFVLELL